MADINKVKFGIKEAHYSILSEDENGNISYGEVKPIKGSRQFSFSKEGGEDSKWYADDGVYYNIPGTNTGYSGDLTVAKIPDEFLIDVLGFFLDTNGVLVEDADAVSKEFALMLEFSGDKMKTRHCFFRCTASRPDINASTIEEQAEPQEETINITAIPVEFTTVIEGEQGEADTTITKRIVKSKANETDSPTQYAAWFTAVQIPEFSAEA